MPELCPGPKTKDDKGPALRWLTAQGISGSRSGRITQELKDRLDVYSVCDVGRMQYGFSLVRSHRV